MNKYKVYYSQRSSILVKARTKKGARRQAWDKLGGFKYGWTRKDFLNHATVELKNAVR